MKKTLSVLLSVLSLSSYAIVSDDIKNSDTSDYEASAGKVMFCIRDLAQKHYDGATRRQGAGIVAQNLIDVYGTRQDVEIAKALCEQYKDMSKEEYVDAIAKEEIQIGTKASNIVDTFAFAKPTCGGFYLNANAALLLGAGLNVGVDKCSSTDGRRWYQFRTGGNIGGGIGANVGVGITSNIEVKDRTIVSTEAHDSQSFGFGVVMNSSRRLSNTIDDTAGIDGVGVGAAAYAGLYAGDVGFKVIPLTNDKKLLINLLNN